MIIAEGKVISLPLAADPHLDWGIPIVPSYQGQKWHWARNDPKDIQLDLTSLKFHQSLKSQKASIVPPLMA